MKSSAFRTRIRVLKHAASPANPKYYKLPHSGQKLSTVFRAKLTAQRQLIFVSFDALSGAHRGSPLGLPEEKRSRSLHSEIDLWPARN